MVTQKNRLNETDFWITKPMLNLMDRKIFTLASKLGYLAPQGQFFMSAKLFIGTPWMQNEVFLKKVGMSYVKMNGFYESQ